MNFFSIPDYGKEKFCHKYIVWYRSTHQVQGQLYEEYSFPKELFVHWGTQIHYFCVPKKQY